MLFRSSHSPSPCTFCPCFIRGGRAFSTLSPIMKQINRADVPPFVEDVPFSSFFPLGIGMSKSNPTLPTDTNVYM